MKSPHSDSVVIKIKEPVVVTRFKDQPIFWNTRKYPSSSTRFSLELESPLVTSAFITEKNTNAMSIQCDNLPSIWNILEKPNITSGQKVAKDSNVSSTATFHWSENTGECQSGSKNYRYIITDSLQTSLCWVGLHNNSNVQVPQRRLQTKLQYDFQQVQINASGAHRLLRKIRVLKDSHW